MKNKFYFLLIGILGVACSLKKDYKAPEVVSLTSPTTSKSAEPHLFTDGDGTVYLSWVEKLEDQTALKFSSLANDQWAAPSTIAYGKTWFVNWADYPMMVTNGNQFAAHFLDKSGQGTYAYDVKLTMSNNKGARRTCGRRPEREPDWDPFLSNGPGAQSRAEVLLRRSGLVGRSGGRGR